MGRGDGSITASDKMSWSRAQARPAVLNAARFGGYTDWRLPTIKELYSLMNFQGTDPSDATGADTSGLTPFIDRNSFDFAYGDTSAGERIIDSQYASNTLYAGSLPGTEALLFGVNFADGRIKGYGLTLFGQDKTFFVQCVRGPAHGVNDLLNNGDGTVSDQASGLMWTRGDSGTGLNWQEALAWTQARNAERYLGHSDWRLDGDHAHVLGRDGPSRRLHRLRTGPGLHDQSFGQQRGLGRRPRGRRAALLTKQLLAFSRKQVMQSVAVDLNEVLASMEPMLRRIIGEDIDLVLALSADLGLARADHGQIEQVILNLATNARDAMPAGGKLTLETRNVDLDAAYSERHLGIAPGPHVMVAVTDSGVGMDEATLGGGGIYVYSEVGQGTTFKIYLPRDRSLSAVDEEPAPIPSPALGSEIVLPVEDDESVRKVAERILVGAGFTVLLAENGPAALLVSERHPAEIHLVLTDVVMPGMSGRVLVDHLTKLRPGIRALFMSGYTDDAIVHQGVLDPGTHFISKPITRAAEKAFSRHRGRKVPGTATVNPPAPSTRTRSPRIRWTSLAPRGSMGAEAAPKGGKEAPWGPRDARSSG